MATAKKTAPAKKTGTAVAVKKAGAVMSPADIKARLEAMAAAQEGKTSPAGGNKIRITQDKQFVLPDGTKTDGPLELVIVDFTSRNEFYPGAFDKKNPVPPVCIAIGDIPAKLVPSDNSPDKQADSCAECPMNAFGSKGDGKACKNTRLLAVLPPDADDDTEMWLMQVSPTALKAWDGYVKDVQRMFSMPPVGVVTTVSFSDAEYAQLSFGSAVPNENVGVHLGRVDQAKQLLAEEPDMTQREAPARAAPAKKAAPAKRR
jgi:hypothetical protein